jgi:peptidoglycan/xylan/chitin deacetylase (PgdA/CDA1 family)
MGLARRGSGFGAVIRPSRKIPCIFALVLAALLWGVAASAGSAGRPHGEPGLQRAGLAQAGRSLVVAIQTAKPVALGSLQRLPGRGGHGPFLCLSLRRPGHSGARRLCLGGGAAAHRSVGMELVNAGGRTIHTETLRARVRRPEPDKLVLALPPGRAGLSPRRYRWRVLERRDSLPRRGERLFRLRPVRPVGCTGGGAGIDSSGPAGRAVVALTFDDGPSEYTPAFLSVLREEHVNATFFEIGQETAGREGTMRRILREGDEIGNHTTHHDEYPGYRDLAATDALIRDATHFEPCLFRPPGGAVDSAVIAAAGEAGLHTIIWNVDPRDWTTPGAAAVYSRVVGATRPGSIVLMHDGGGDRSGTLAALPRIIDTLRARGYRFATVSSLLGHRMIYQPYG